MKTFSQPCPAALVDAERPRPGGLSREAALLVQHREGNPAAFPELVESYRRVVYSHLSRCAVPADDRDDLFQEIFLKLHRAAPSFDVSRALQPWLFTIVANTVRNYFRKRRVQEVVAASGGLQTEELRHVPDERPNASDVALGREGAQVLGEAVAALSLPLRQVLLLVTVEGLSLNETAECLAIPLNTVKSRLRRARLALIETRTKLNRPGTLAGTRGLSSGPESGNSNQRRGAETRTLDADEGEAE